MRHGTVQGYPWIASGEIMDQARVRLRAFLADHVRIHANWQVRLASNCLQQYVQPLVRVESAKEADAQLRIAVRQRTCTTRLQQAVADQGDLILGDAVAP